MSTAAAADPRLAIVRLLRDDPYHASFTPRFVDDVNTLFGTTLERHCHYAGTIAESICRKWRVPYATHLLQGGQLANYCDALEAWMAKGEDKRPRRMLFNLTGAALVFVDATGQRIAELPSDGALTTLGHGVLPLQPVHTDGDSGALIPARTAACVTGLNHLQEGIRHWKDAEDAAFIVTPDVARFLEAYPIAGTRRIYSPAGATSDGSGYTCLDAHDTMTGASQ